jgi:hypothetical protein
MGTPEARDPGTLYYGIVDPKTGLQNGQIVFGWNPANRMYQPLFPGVNLHPHEQNKGLYPAFLKELSRYVDIGSTGTSAETGSLPNALKVWRKLGAVEEQVVENESLSGPRAFVLRRKK